jgi:tetratricopeptide (TPR) repeat protein
MSRDVLDKCRNSYGELHPVTIKAIAQLAYQLKDTSFEAASLYQQGMELYDTARGPYNKERLILLNNLAHCLSFQGRLDEAELHFRKALELNSLKRGEDHPETLDSAFSLADCLIEREKFEEAESLYTKVLEGRRRMLGEDHQGCNVVQIQLVRISISWGRIEEARRRMEQVDMEPFRGTIRATRLLALNMAEILLSLGRYDDAEILLRTMAASPQADVVVISKLAIVLSQVGKMAEARRLAVEALPRINELEGWFRMMAMVDLGCVMHRVERFEEARTLLQEATTALKEVYGDQDGLVMVAFVYLGIAVRGLGMLDEAMKTIEEARQTLEKVFGPEHPRTLFSSHELALTKMRQGKADAAETLLRDVWEKRKKVLGEDHPNAWVTLCALAASLQVQERWAASAELFKQAIDKQPSVLVRMHPMVVAALQGLALCLSALGGKDEEVQQLTQAARECLLELEVDDCGSGGEGLSNQQPEVAGPSQQSG